MHHPDNLIATTARASYFNISGAVWSYGLNQNGERGIGHRKENENLQQAILPRKCQKLCSSRGRTMMFLLEPEYNKSSLYGVGDNYYGTLGIGKVCNPQELIEYQFDDFKVNNTKGTAVEIEFFRNMEIENVFSYLNTYVLLKNGDLYAFGYNTSKSLGITNLKSNRNIFIPNLVKGICERKKIFKVTPGENHTIFLTLDGLCYGCGNNKYSQLGMKTKERLGMDTPRRISFFSDRNIRIKDVDAGFRHSIFLTVNNKVYVSGELGIQKKMDMFKIDGWLPPMKLNDLIHQKIDEEIPVRIKCGCGFGMVLFMSGKCLIFGGSKYFKNLGYKGEKMINVHGEKIINMSGGFNFAIFLTNNGHVYGYGKNDYGQLGKEISKKYEARDPTLLLGGMKLFNSFFLGRLKKSFQKRKFSDITVKIRSF